MFEVGCGVKVCDIDAGSGWRVRPLHLDQLGQFEPPELLLSRRTKQSNEILIVTINTRIESNKRSVQAVILIHDSLW